MVHHTQEQAQLPQFATLFKNICLQYELTFVDVHALANAHLHRKSSAFSTELRNQLKMSHQDAVSLASCSSDLVVRMVADYLGGQEGADVLLLNYPSVNNAEVYPRASDQLMAVEKGLGSVRFVCVISKEEVDVAINDPQLVLERPPEPVKEKKEGEEAAVDAPADPAGDEVKKPEFSIYDYAWSDSNGRSKSLGQWYCSLKPHVEKVL